MSRLFDRLTVAGVGLIGGSLALAARDAGLVGEVIGLGRREANLRVARARGIIDRVAGDPAAAAAADAIVLEAPVGACAALAAALAPHAAPGTVLTDVASVKAPLLAALEAAWPDPGLVVGGHPIAGSDAAGAAAARADLFRGRLCIVTPGARTHPGSLARVRALWEGVGARVEELSPRDHDEILGRVSHLPHLVAYALVAAADEARVGGRPVLPYAGAGLRDTTRIAGSMAELWRDIALANAGPLRAALAEFRAVLDRLEALVAAGDGAGLAAALDAARDVRRALDEEPSREELE